MAVIHDFALQPPELPALFPNRDAKVTDKPGTTSLFQRHSGPAAFYYLAVHQVAREMPGQNPAVWRVPQLVESPTFAPVVPRERPIKSPDRFVALEKWEGCVVEVGKDSFTALLTDLRGAVADQEAEFPILDEVSPEDIDLVQPGAVFYWTIGYHSKPGGTRSHSSEIRFRRLPSWSEAEIADAKRIAAGWKKALGL